VLAGCTTTKYVPIEVEVPKPAVPIECKTPAPPFPKLPEPATKLDIAKTWVKAKKAYRELKQRAEICSKFAVSVGR
jgi:hypothetical protein